MPGLVHNEAKAKVVTISPMDGSRRFIAPAPEAGILKHESRTRGSRQSESTDQLIDFFRKQFDVTLWVV